MHNKILSFSFRVKLLFANIIQKETRNKYGKFKILFCLDFRRSRTAAEKSAVPASTRFREKPHKTLKEAPRNLYSFILYFDQLKIISFQKKKEDPGNFRINHRVLRKTWMSNLRLTDLSCHSLAQERSNKTYIELKRFCIFLKRYRTMSKIKLEIYKEVLKTLLNQKQSKHGIEKNISTRDIFFVCKRLCFSLIA